MARRLLNRRWDAIEAKTGSDLLRKVRSKLNFVTG
jgi:hypothetical protein